MLKNICERKDANNNKSALDRAAAAITGEDFHALSSASKEIASLVEERSYLVEPLIIIAEHLAQNPNFLQQSIETYVKAARHAPLGSKQEKQAAMGFVKSVNTIPEASKRQRVFETASINSIPDSRLEQQAATECMKIINALPEITESIAAYMGICGTANQGSVLQRQAMLGIFKHVDKLPEASDRAAAFTKIAAYAHPGSDFECRAITGFIKNVEALPEISERIAALISAAEYVYASDSETFGIELQRQALVSITKYPYAVFDYSNRTVFVPTDTALAILDAYERAAIIGSRNAVLLGRELEEQLASNFVDHVQIISDARDLPDCRSVYKRAAMKAMQGSKLEQVAVRGFIVNLPLYDVSERIAVLEETILDVSCGKKLLQESLENLLKNIDAQMPDVSDRIAAIKRIARKANFGSELEQALQEELKKREVPVIPLIPKQNEARLFVKQFKVA